ncbi:MAG: hypothetical protein HC869_01725 [Rhodospirillales bacterium]|nr:hypothetical protein [Rhodospirillales bacterium]
MTASNANDRMLSKDDAEIVMAMIARGDRVHDIAALFGVGESFVDEVKHGSYAAVVAAQTDFLPPMGPPGIKGRQLRFFAEELLRHLNSYGGEQIGAAKVMLMVAIQQYDKHET